MGKNKINSELIKLGSDPNLHHGSLSDPIYKTSTIIFNDYKSFLDAKKNKFKKPYYGRFGNYSVKRFEELICQLYKSQDSVITSSGLSAITISLLSFSSKGDEVLITENCYEPVYNFCINELKRFGIKTYFYKNNNSSFLNTLINNKTKLIYIESPGSLNYEVEDIEEIVKIAKRPEYEEARKIITDDGLRYTQFMPLLAREKLQMFAQIRDNGLQRPTNLIWGLNDPTAPVDMCRALFDLCALRESKTQMHIINQAGHFSFREHPKEFNACLTGFIEGVA